MTLISGHLNVLILSKFIAVEEDIDNMGDLAFEDIFAVAEQTDNRDIHSSPSNAIILGWLRANASPRIRNALSSFLLHPLIRSYQARSILGRTSTNEYLAIWNQWS